MTDFEIQFDRQTKLIYSMIVAGKSANFADKATANFLVECAKIIGVKASYFIPFYLIAHLTSSQREICLRRARTGNYSKLSKALDQILALKTPIDFDKCTPDDLEKIHGIGKKTSRFFIMWIRPNEEYAALDVHVLRWMRSLGYNAPKATPSNPKKYRELELAFISEAAKRGKTARQLDMEIWEAGAKRTQETATPNL
jgi:endonuclease III